MKRDKFNKIFHDYLRGFCEHLKVLLGPDVFEPFLFGANHTHRVQDEQVEFHEALLNYQLCHIDYTDKKMAERVVEHGYD